MKKMMNCTLKSRGETDTKKKQQISYERTVHALGLKATKST